MDTQGIEYQNCKCILIKSCLITYRKRFSGLRIFSLLKTLYFSFNVIAPSKEKFFEMQRSNNNVSLRSYSHYHTLTHTYILCCYCIQYLLSGVTCSNDLRAEVECHVGSFKLLAQPYLKLLSALLSVIEITIGNMEFSMQL